MPQITQITPQKSRRAGLVVGNFDRILNNQPSKSRFFNVFIDGKFAFGVDAETLIKEKLTEDKALSDADVVRLKEVSLYSKLLNSALNFLSFRPRSKREVSTNLKSKIYKILGKGDVDLAGRLENQVTSKVEDLGYLNDGEFARWWVGQRVGGKNPRGPALIKRELFSKGINREIIEDSFKEFKEVVSPDNLATMLIKKGRLLKKRPLIEQRRKLYDFLLRRGFGFDVVRASVDKYLKEA